MCLFAMVTTETTSTFENKFIEVVELLLQQQLVADSRRESSDREQMAMLEHLQNQLQTLMHCVEMISPPVNVSHRQETTQAGIAPVAKSVPPTSTAASSSALSEWERQKQTLLQGLETQLDSEASTAYSTMANGLPEAPANQADSVIKEHTSHDWIEHLDPNDPALSDDGERRDLVARLRKLEVELSLERAKIARDRSELDGQLNDMKRAERQQGIDLEQAADGKNKEQGTRNRMLRFLGRKSP